MEKREYHLSFCKICKNRKFSPEEGLICKLTTKIAEFDKNCLNFIIDEKELIRRKKEFETEINKKYAITKIDSFFIETLSISKFEKAEKIRTGNYSSVEETHKLKFKKDKANNKGILWILGSVFLLMLYGNYINNFSWDLKSNNIIGVIGVLVLFTYFYYKAFYHNYKTILTIDDNGIHQKGKILFWNNIIAYGVLSGTGDNYLQKDIIIGTISSGIQKIDISKLNVSSEQFIEILQLNSRNVLQQSL
ncbi:hypothetical protein JBL43_19905 [Aureibaculum sp. A20]|uniref:DUF304 domain-containing protein n=1 Tax=Aureibaculum flavum TaxID=2795986 RepID=A0ABS0WXD0_9FLAO|nr:hypothetical protein [Aureibaculum flavum]MBJ2176523.1 hypothetical protein [Aureibaculum flavum]